MRKKNSGLAPMAVKMKAYRAEYLRIEMAGGPVFPNLRDAIRGNSAHKARYAHSLD